MFLRQSTASQEIVLGRFVASTDGDTEESGLTIANTDIKLIKHGGTTLISKNSGGATIISNGMYSAVLDATDSDTLGNLEVHVHVAGALAVKREYVVLSAAVYDAIVAGTGQLRSDLHFIGGTTYTGAVTLKATDSSGAALATAAGQALQATAVQVENVLAIANGSILKNILVQAQGVRVPVLICSDSNTYTKGGWQQGVSEALQGIGRLYGGQIEPGGGGQALVVNANDPGGDYQAPLGGVLSDIGFATSGAPAHCLAIFNGFSSRFYAFLDVGGAPTEGYTLFNNATFPFTGFDPSAAYTFHVWGASFSSGGGSMANEYRLGAAPYTTYSSFTIDQSTGGNARYYQTFSVAAASRVTTDHQQVVWNRGGVESPKLFIHGKAIELTDVSDGFAVHSFLMDGGRSSALNLDVYKILRTSAQELIAMIHEHSGEDGPCLVIVNYGLNDRNETTAASHAQSGLVVSGSDTTVVVSGFTGSLIGQLVTVSYLDGSLLATDETHTITGWNEGTQTITTASWTHDPVAGDAVRVSPSAEVVSSVAGYKTDIQALCDLMRTDLEAEGLDPVFLVIPNWMPTSGSDVTAGYYAAMAALADEFDDIVAVDTQTIMPFTSLKALNPFDQTHIGGHAISALLRKIFALASVRVLADNRDGDRTATEVSSGSIEAAATAIQAKTDDLTFTVPNSVDATAAIDSQVVEDAIDAAITAAGLATSEDIAAIIAQSSKLIVVYPLRGDEMTLVKGDEYSASSNVITLTKASGKQGWPTSISTIDFSCYPDDVLLEEVPTATGLDDIALASVTASGGTLALTTTNTNALTATTGSGRYRFWFVANRTTATKTIRTGVLKVITPDQN